MRNIYYNTFFNWFTEGGCKNFAVVIEMWNACFVPKILAPIVAGGGALCGNNRGGDFGISI